MINQGSLDVYRVAENYVITLIRNEHPEWIDEDGSCIRCEEYYRELDKLIVIED